MKPPPREGIKVVVISDTHGKHDQIVMPEGDLLIHCGDATMKGDFFEIVAFNKWLGTLRDKYRQILFCPGNHDLLFEKNPGFARSLITNAVLVQDRLIEFGGLKIYASPWQPRFHDWAFNLDPEEIARKWEAIPDKVDILVTHGPPYGILDKSCRDERSGCRSLLTRVTAVRPALHLFGHIHEGYGCQIVGETMHMNASICDARYRPVNSPLAAYITRRGNIWRY